MSESTVSVLDLMVGDRVRDDYTEWAEVVTIDDTRDGVRVEWRLSDGRRDVTTYDRDARFTPLPSDKFTDRFIEPVD